MTAETNNVPNIAEVNALIAASWQAMDYRPTVVLGLVNPEGRAILVESPRHPGEWGLVQGGIEREESIPVAAIRELNEELGIMPQDVVLGGVVEAMKSDIPDGHSDKRGFSKGKLYIVQQALYTGDGLLTPNPDEVRTVIFANNEERERRLAHKRPEKAELIRRALATARQVA